MHIELSSEPFEPLTAMARHQRETFGAGGQYGALASFIGTMRHGHTVDLVDDLAEDHIVDQAGDKILAMHLEHYPGMTERHLTKIGNEATQRWKILDLMIIHRIGIVRPGDPIVLVAVWSVHRGGAFDACRSIMEDLKSKAPFWKKETLRDGSRWVANNTPG